MTPADDLVRRLVERAASPYQRASGFAWRFARHKLARDPLFEKLLATGAVPDAACLVDLGCGQALLAAWLSAARAAWTASPERWPATWPAPPRVATYLGVDQSRRDIGRAQPAMAAFARVFRGDVRTLGLSMLERADVVTLLDVLQYIDRAAQERVLDALATRLPPWGVVVLRVGDAGTGSAWRSDVVDLVVCALRGHPRGRLQRRPLGEWRALLEHRGFVVEVLHDPRADGAAAPHGFANVLLRAARTTPDAPVRSPVPGSDCLPTCDPSTSPRTP